MSGDGMSGDGTGHATGRGSSGPMPAFDRGESPTPLPRQSRQGPDRTLRRLRSADPDRLRRRSCARRAARSAKSAFRSPISAICGRCSTAFRSTDDEHLDDDQRDGRVAAVALYRGRRRATASRAPRCSGTTQNDIIKEYLSRGTYVFPPAPSMRLTSDTILFATREMPKWNPMNVCSYHLQEAGATPVQELAYALATAIAVLDEVKAAGAVDGRDFPRGRRTHFLLRQCRHALHHRNLQAARLRRFVGRDHARALRRRRIRRSAVPLWRAGQFARSDRAAAGEQCLSHPHRNAGGDPVEERARAAPCSCRRGTRRLGCRAPSISNGRSGCSRFSPTKPTCSNIGDIFDGSAEIDRKVEELKAAAREELRRIDAHGRRGRRGRDGLHEAARSSHPMHNGWRASKRARRWSSASIA